VALLFVHLLFCGTDIAVYMKRVACMPACDHMCQTLCALVDIAITTGSWYHRNDISYKAYDIFRQNVLYRLRNDMRNDVCEVETTAESKVHHELVEAADCPQMN